MLIEKLVDGVMVPIVGGLDDKNGIYTIHEAEYSSICGLVDESRKNDKEEQK